MSAGFSLLECLLAGAILSLMTLVLFEGIIVASRIARENSDLLQAEAIAWDAVWKRFNENFDTLTPTGTSPAWETLTAAAAPDLFRYDTPPKILVTVGGVPLTTGGVASDLKWIRANVEWGPRGRRKQLYDSATGRGTDVFVYRGALGRVCEY